MTLQLIFLGLLLVCSAFFSGAETALFALSRHELSRLRQSRSRSARLVADLLRRPRRTLLTLMVGNITVNMFIFAASLSIFQDLAGEGSIWGPVLGLVSPVVVTLFGELLPKGLAIVLRMRIAPRISPIVLMVEGLLSPLTTVLMHVVVAPLTRLLTGSRPPASHVTLEELDELVEISAKHRIINTDENAMLGEVIRLSELRVYDVMVPRVDVLAFDINDDPARLRQLMRENRFTKLPVYDGEIDNMLGVVYAKDLFLNPAREPATLVRPVHYVPEIITLTQLINHFRRTRTQLAIVVNEYGAMVGLVTMEDVAKLIVGDLTAPAGADERPTWEKIDERRYRISGRISIDDWAEQFNIRGLDEPVTTLAGLILDRLGRLPEVGDQVRLGNFLLTVESLSGRRIEWVLLELLDGQATSPLTVEGPT